MVSILPVSSDTATISLKSLADIAAGFSRTTFLPAFNMSIANFLCESLGVAIVTMSISLSFNTDSRESYVNKPLLLAALLRSGLISYTPFIFSLLISFFIELQCHSPIPP